MLFKDTIVAISTAAGVGAIGLVRLSGAQSLAIVSQLFAGKALERQATHTVHFGRLYDRPHKAGGAQLIDEVVVTLFLGNKSFTGEDTVEIAAHGSPYILDQVLHACIMAGARLAAPGEFTQRAFLNGKMDLAQAEAVGDLIAAENKASHEIALNQMRGGVSSELAALREQLINFTALMELELDFSDEDVEFADRTALKGLIQNLKFKIQNLIKSFEYGNAIKNGVPVAIIGKPNAGKSTLLNALLKEERAIVSDIAGTTRDVIEEAINLEGITFRFIDTAGIRNTEDTIEAIGVERAKEKVQQAKVVIHLYEQDTDILDELSDSLQDKLVFNLQSKVDQSGAENDTAALQQRYPAYQHFGLSVKTHQNLDRLTDALVVHFKAQQGNQSVIITNIRHKEALQRAFEALEQVDTGMQMGLSGDLLSLHLKDALYQLGTITGKIEVDRDILGAIFGKFCIGK
ncbi:MAG: tRNA uridine-5-carboxymethylaminomethyl(34) synthesis GTPase MnmE [Bacteroidetes bacterium 43-16]|nr:MAG: tRNA uridine-5-carboxymethylaminomethyl(34) synthesis GTPase MnmE [Bacteroidetes bacterium 43-16]